MKFLEDSYENPDDIQALVDATHKLLCTIEAFTTKNESGDLVVSQIFHLPLIDADYRALLGAYTRCMLGGKLAGSQISALMIGIVQACSYPAEVWNERQAKDPGGDHDRWEPGETIPESIVHELRRALVVAKRMGFEPSEDDQSRTGRSPVVSKDEAPLCRLVKKKYEWDRPRLALWLQVKIDENSDASVSDLARDLSAQTKCSIEAARGAINRSRLVDIRNQARTRKKLNNIKNSRTKRN